VHLIAILIRLATTGQSKSWIRRLDLDLLRQCPAKIQLISGTMGYTLEAILTKEPPPFRGSYSYYLELF